MPRIPRIPRLPGRMAEMNRLRARFYDPEVRRDWGMPSDRGYGPDRMDAELWNDILAQEQARREYINAAMRVDDIAQRHFAPWDYETPVREFRFRDPFTREPVEFRGSKKDYWDRYKDRIPKGIEWMDEAAYSSTAPYERQFVPGETDVFRAESYGDPDFLDDIYRLQQRWERRPIPSRIPLKPVTGFGRR